MVTSETIGTRDFRHIRDGGRWSFWKQPNITFYTESLLIKGNLSDSRLRQGPFHLHV